MNDDILFDDEWEDERPSDIKTDNKGPSLSPPPPGGSDFLPARDLIILILIGAVIFLGVQNYRMANAASGSAFSQGGSCCGTDGGAAGGGPSIAELEELGKRYYASNYGDGEVDVVIEDFGCHIEIYIYEDDELVLSLSYAGGSIYEI